MFVKHVIIQDRTRGNATIASIEVIGNRVDVRVDDPTRYRVVEATEVGTKTLHAKDGGSASEAVLVKKD